MYTGWLGVSTLLLCLLGLLMSRRWAYVCLCALMEGCWVCLTTGYGFLTIEYNDASLLFWALSCLVFSAVELCLCLYTFVLLADNRGASLDVVLKCYFN